MSAARLRVLVGFGAFGAFWGAWGAVLPDVRVRSGADDGALGVALLMIGAGALLSMPLTGRLIDRRGGRVLPSAFAAFGLAAALVPFAASPVALAGSLFLLGAAAGATDVAINAAGSAEEAHSGPLLNLAHAAFSGCVLSASLLTAAGRAVGGGPLVVLGSVAGVLALVAGWLARTGAVRVSAPRSAPAPRAGGRSPVLLLLGLLGALAYLVENAWQSWSAVHLQDSLAAPPGLASLGPAVFAAATTVGRLLGQGAARTVPDRVLLSAAAVLAAAGTALCAGAASVGTALVGLAVAGLGTSVCAPTILSVTGRWAGPDRQASAISTVTTMAYLGFLVGPAAVGLTSAASDLPTALLAVAGVAIVLAVLARAMPRVPRLPEPESRVSALD